MQETQVPSLGREDPLERAMATLCGILAWRIPWMEELGVLHTVHGVAKSWTCVKLLSMHRAIKTRAQVHWGSAVALGVKPESVLCLPFQFPFRRIFLASEHSLLPFHNSSAFKQMFKKCPLCFSLSARKFFQIISLKIGTSLALCLK